MENCHSIKKVEMLVVLTKYSLPSFCKFFLHYDVYTM